MPTNNRCNVEFDVDIIYWTLVNSQPKTIPHFQPLLIYIVSPHSFMFLDYKYFEL